MQQFSKDELDHFERQLRLQRAALLASLGQRLHGGQRPGELAQASAVQGIGKLLRPHLPAPHRLCGEHGIRESMPAADTAAGLLADTGFADPPIEVAELADIDAALARLQGGEFGRCDRCGTRIAQGRLRVQPAARMCLPCQEAAELRR